MPEVLRGLLATGFALAKTLAPFGMPLGIACLLLVAALLSSGRRPWVSRLLLLLALASLWAAGSGWVAARLMGPLERAYARPPETQTAPAAVVLAGAVDLARSTPERVEFYDRPERILEGMRLVREGRAQWLFIAGGSGDPYLPDVSEAELLGAFARDLGIRPEAIVLQGRSRTTHEDAVETARVLRERGIDRFFLVTSAFHLPRAVGCFREQGLEPIPYPVDYRATPPHTTPLSFVPTASALHQSTLALHEYVGYVVYRVLGYL